MVAEKVNKSLKRDRYMLDWHNISTNDHMPGCCSDLSGDISPACVTINKAIYPRTFRAMQSA